MGMDVTAYYVYGVKLPEEFGISDKDISDCEAIEDIFDPCDKPKPYPRLEAIMFGSYDFPVWIVAIKNSIYSCEWLADKPISVSWGINTYDADELTKFCENFDIEEEPEHYLGCYVSV